MIAMGAQVLVLNGDMNRRGFAEALRAEVVPETGALPLAVGMFKWRTCPVATSKPLEVPMIGYCNLENEGITWARGWDDEAGRALRAAWALSEPRILIPTRIHG